MAYLKKLNYVRKSVGIAAAYEQLAEECSELAQAAVKMITTEKLDRWAERIKERIEEKVKE